MEYFTGLTGVQQSMNPRSIDRQRGRVIDFQGSVYFGCNAAS
jgi:hypothetical protein